MYVYVAIALAAALLAGAGTWRVQDWRYAAREAERLQAQREQERNDRRVVDQAAVGHEQDKAQIRTEFITITQTVERIVREPFYAAADAPACLDDDGLQQLRTAIGAASAASQPARAVPGPRPAGGRQ